MSVTMPDPKLLEEFFLYCAGRTYVGNEVPKTSIPELPGSNVYRIECDDLLYVDMYFINGDYSYGHTGIWVSGTPAWEKSYDGWCQDNNADVIETLKAALYENYVVNKVFYGGRGPKSYVVHRNPHNDSRCYEYRNRPNSSTGCDFRRSSGRETIRNFCSGKRSIVFWHQYQSLLLYR